MLKAAPALAAALVLSLGGCGKASDSNGQAASGEEQDAPAAVAAQTPPPAAFQQCMGCHTTRPGVNAVGPSLFGVVGRKAGNEPDYNYSEALKNSGLTWDRKTLDEWLASPIKKVPGARMVISVPDEAQRQAIIDYLQTLK